MSHDWEPDNTSLPGKEPLWLITLFAFSLVIGFGWGWRSSRSEYTSIQHHYWDVYYATSSSKYRIKSPLGTEQKKQYEITCWVDSRTGRIVGAVTPQNEFLSESDRLRQHSRQEVRLFPLTPTTMYDWLGKTIYAGLSPSEIIIGLLHDGSVAALFTFFLLLCFALIADLKRAKVRKDGQRRRGAQFTTTRQFNRGTR